MSQQLRYSERIAPSLGATLSLIALIASITFAIWVALGLVIAVSLALMATIFAGVWWVRSIHNIELGHLWLRVNDAKVQTQYLGEIEILERSEWKSECGINFDPMAFHAHRFWHRTGLKAGLLDGRDPHTAWVIATKNPVALAKALKKD